MTTIKNPKIDGILLKQLKCGDFFTYRGNLHTYVCQELDTVCCILWKTTNKGVWNVPCRIDVIMDAIVYPEYAEIHIKRQ